MLEFHPTTSPQVRSVLTSIYKSRVRVRLYLGDVNTGASWGETYDVWGYIGRSTGPRHIPILLHNTRSMGGGHILDHCIVAIRTKDKWLYKHPSFSFHSDDRVGKGRGIISQL